MEPTLVLKFFEGVVDLLHNFPKEKASLQQGLFSQREDMRVPSSVRDQGKGYLNDDAFSIDEDKGEKE